uniref:Uncharacterized protein n=1 Tax=Arundo donax TaxID=35708 RepID=A0A0A9D824_ARUDO
MKFIKNCMLTLKLQATEFSQVPTVMSQKLSILLLCPGSVLCRTSYKPR